MKAQFAPLSSSIAKFNDMMADFAENATDPRYMKVAKKLLAEWKNVVTHHNTFELLVEPIQPIPIEFPFEGEAFAKMWQMYKEYLLEDHKANLGSRRETILARRLAKLSGQNEHRAVEMLEFFISNGYKNIFKPSDRQLTGDEPAKAEAEPTKLTKKKRSEL